MIHEKVYVGHTKNVLSLVDKQLIISNVCTTFGQHVKYIVCFHNEQIMK